MELDTGAGVSIIRWQTFHQLWREEVDRKPRVLPLKVQLQTYNNHPIKVVGEYKLSVRHKGLVLLIIVEGNGPNLVGCNWIIP